MCCILLVIELESSILYVGPNLRLQMCSVISRFSFLIKISLTTFEDTDQFYVLSVSYLINYYCMCS